MQTHELNAILHQIEMLIVCAALMFALMLTLLASAFRGTPIRVLSQRTRQKDDRPDEEL
jgi:hypothetical protein